MLCMLWIVEEVFWWAADGGSVLVICNSIFLVDKQQVNYTLFCLHLLFQSDVIKNITLLAKSFQIINLSWMNN